MPTRSEVVIIGGGAIGLAIALELALQNVSVTVLSRDFQEAALHAAAGMLAPQAEQILPGPMLELCLRSRALYPEWAAKLESLSGINPEYWPCGIVAPLYADNREPVPYTGSQDPTLAKHPCDRAALDALVPNLGSDVLNGWWFPDDGQVNNQTMAQALRIAVQSLGVTLHDGAEVQQIVSNDSRVLEVRTATTTYQAAHYILATGAWSGQLCPDVPVHPRKGQMLALRSPQSQLLLQHVLFGSEVYIVPRQNGRIVIGATSEAVGFLPHNTAVGVRHLLDAALRLYPPLQDFLLERTWWGFRPATPDELPILGPSPYTNLTLATGHYRNGILLAPITAQLISAQITQHSDPLLSSFAWNRFSP